MASEIRAAFEAGRAQVRVEQVEGHRAVVVAPAGHAVTELPRGPLERPEVLEATHTMHELPSFLQYLRDYANDDTVVFAHHSDGSMLAIIDYHQTGEQGPAGTLVLPRHCAHRVRFTPVATPEWTAWTGHSGKAYDQEAFAEFIEDWGRWITSPSAADMLQIANCLHVARDAQFQSSRRMDNGQVQFTYNEELTGQAGSLEIPQVFHLRVQPFMGSASAELECRFRYRLAGSTLKLFYKVLTPEHALRAVVEDHIRQVAEVRPVFVGQQ